MVAGRLASFLDTWKVLTRDTWVLNAIEGYQIPFVGAPSQLKIPQEGVFSQEHKALLLEEIQDLLKKGGNYPTIRKHNRIYFNPLPSAEEEWSDEASDQPETVEPMGGDPPFQDGGNSYSSGSAPPGRLDGESGPKGRLLHHSHLQGPPELFEVHGRWDLLPVHLPAIRPVLCPLDLHQGDEANDDSAEVMGHQNNHLYQRHVDTGQFQEGSLPTLGSACVPPRGTGLHHKLGEITFVPSPGNRVSRTDGGLIGHPTEASWREAAANPQGGCSVADLRSSVSSSTLPVYREAECSFTSHSSGTSVLPYPSGQLTRSSGSGEPGLQSEAASQFGSSGGVGVGGSIT